MLIKLENVGKIKSSEIELQGITVIAGNNRTGKSTVGKTLYCIFSAFKSGNVLRERKRTFNDILSSYAPLFQLQLFSPRNSHIQYLFDEPSDDFFERKPHIQDLFFVDFSDSTTTLENITKKIEDFISNNKIELPKDAKEGFFQQIKKLFETKDETIERTILNRYLQVEFSGNVNHINSREKTAKIYTKMKNEEIELEIKDNICSEIKKETSVYADVFYIDTSFALDELDTYKRRRGYVHRYEYEHRYKLKQKLTKINLDTSVINDNTAKEKIAKIFDSMPDSMPAEIKNGAFIYEDSRLLYKEPKHSVALGFNSISAGMKPFLIIKRLLESAEIKNKSVIILDEPEVNLHPEWQLFFAEFIVLLQKEYDATILLATHSPYFLEAIETYSKKHKTEEKCRYYLARNEDDIYSAIEDCTYETDKIYELFAEPFGKMQSSQIEG